MLGKPSLNHGLYTLGSDGKILSSLEASKNLTFAEFGFHYNEIVSVHWLP